MDDIDSKAKLTEVATGSPEAVDAGASGSVKDDAPEVDEAALEAEKEKLRREREARAQALTLEIVGDLPYAEVKPPENVLFVCKLNPVTEDEDLNTIFSRFGTIVSCEVIKDKRTGESLQYAFIEYEHQKDCEQAYTKMSGVLIDDHRIHVDFSQSVSRLSDTWRTRTNTRRREQASGFGGVAGLEKRRHYRKVDTSEQERREKDKYRMVFDKEKSSRSTTSNGRRRYAASRSRSPDSPQRQYEHKNSHHASRDRSREHNKGREDRNSYRHAPRARSRGRRDEKDRDARHRRFGDRGDERGGASRRPEEYDRYNPQYHQR